MKKTLFILAAIMLITVSCDKNQKAVKMLNGVWTLTSTQVTNLETLVVNGIPANEDNVQELDFDNCKLKNDEFCTVTSIITLDNDDPTYWVSVYKISEDGTKLEMGESKYDTELDEFEIISIDEESLVMTWVDEDEEFSYESTYTLNK